MPQRAFDIEYERGGLRLGWDRKRDGTLRSPFLQISWYDSDARRFRFQTTGTADLGVAKIALDQKYQEASGGACAFCAACGQAIASARDYLLLDALCDYFDEKGKKADAADSVKARLKHFRDFLEATTRAALTCAQVDDTIIDAFRDWSQKEPIRVRNKDGQEVASRERSPATTEESLNRTNVTTTGASH